MYIIQTSKTFSFNTEENHAYTPLIVPYGVMTWEGFEVTPVLLVALSDGQQYFAFDGEQWIPTRDPIWYTPEQIRDTLNLWPSPSLQCYFPQPPAEVRIGYECLKELQQYCLEYALPELLKKPIRLSTWVQADETGMFVPTVPLTTMSNVWVKQSHCLPIEAQHYEDKVVLSKPVDPGETVNLVYDVIPEVEYVDGLFQATGLPAIAIRKLRPENQRRIEACDRIKGSGGKVYYSHAKVSYDLPVELTIIGRTEEDALIVRNRIEALVSIGKLEAQPFALEVGLQMMTSLPDSGDTLSLKLKLINLTRGEFLTVEES